MLTLAIDCATKSIGLALLNEEDVCAEFYLNLERHHTEILLPALDQLFSMAGRAPEEVDLLACTVGPGSFTGLRIGVSTVKGLALAMAKPVVGISTLEALAVNAIPSHKLICPMIDARKNQVYAALYRIGPDSLPEAATQEKLVDVEKFLHDMGHKKIVFLGDGAIRHQRLIGETLMDRAVICGRSQQKILASAVGVIGLHRFRNGRVLDTCTFAPSYLRLSGAEIKNGNSALSPLAG
jgi:tRNA threonylcarbamoyladenosine biosynthesis protein TsaB